MVDEVITVKEQYYDLNKYADEVAEFVVKKKADLDVLSNMQSKYRELKDAIFSGTVTSDDLRFPQAAEVYKVYKSAILESSLSGYSALLDTSGYDGYSVLRAPELKKVMTEQFKRMSLLERISGDTVDDWILKGEAVSLIKLKEKKEEYRVKNVLKDATTGEDILKFTMKQINSYQDLDIERIDPLDFFVDAYDYQKDPRGCAKIVRSFIDAKTLLTSDAYPLLSEDQKAAIITGVGRNGGGGFSFNWGPLSRPTGYDKNKTDTKKIEVFTYYGDYITRDHKVLINIKAVVVDNMIADIKYSNVNTNRIIYAAYKVDEDTHRGITPIATSLPINKLVNRVIDLFITNLDFLANPLMIFTKGSMTLQQAKDAIKRRLLEYNAVGPEDKPTFWSPPPATTTGLQLMEVILNQNKNVLGLNNYMAGSTDGAVRTARESSIIFQRANARMRVETDVFNYNYMLPLFVAYYTFNRELALVVDRPLAEIYTDPQLKASISTNASKADKEGELNRLMQMLQLPIAQMIFANLTPQQVVLAVRYLMAKADLTDMDNLLELQEESADTPTRPEIDLTSVGVIPEQPKEQQGNNVDNAQS